jgi:hypothetical protein
MILARSYLDILAVPTRVLLDPTLVPHHCCQRCHIHVPFAAELGGDLLCIVTLQASNGSPSSQQQDNELHTLLHARIGPLETGIVDICDLVTALPSM